MIHKQQNSAASK